MGGGGGDSVLFDFCYWFYVILSDTMKGLNLLSQCLWLVETSSFVLLVVTDVWTTCVEVIFRVTGSGLCSPEKHSKTSFEKKLFFCVGEYAEYGFDQQG